MYLWFTNLYSGDWVVYYTAVLNFLNYGHVQTSIQCLSLSPLVEVSERGCMGEVCSHIKFSFRRTMT